MKQDKIKIENGRLAIILRKILGKQNLINKDKKASIFTIKLAFLLSILSILLNFLQL